MDSFGVKFNWIRVYVKPFCLFAKLLTNVTGLNFFEVAVQLFFEMLALGKVEYKIAYLGTQGYYVH